MAEYKSTTVENLTTRAFVLIRKLSGPGGLSPEEIHELVEIQKDMPATSFDHKLDALKEVLDTRLDSQDKKYTLLLWFIGVGVGLIIASNFAS